MEGTYQLLSRDILGLLHSNIWWFQGVKLNENRFSLARAHELYLEGIYCVKDIWDSDNRTFHSWDEAQTKIHLTHTYDEDWATLTSKMNDQWRHFLEDDPTLTYSPTQSWFFKAHLSIPLHTCINNNSPCLSQLNILRLAHISDVLANATTCLESSQGSSMQWKLFSPHEFKGNKKNLLFLWENGPTLYETHIVGGRLKGTISSLSLYH
jgi:hypothetical protein